MDISICIVNWNTKDLLQKCLSSIHQITSGIEFEVILLDNGSSDGSADMVRRNFPNCLLLESRENLGFVRGNNLAVKHARGENVLFLNPDTELLTNAVQGMHAYLCDKPDAGAIGCRINNSDGSIQYTCACTYPTPFNELSSLFMMNRLFPNSAFFSSREMSHWNHFDSKDVDCLSGACMMVRSDVLRTVGLFDEKIYMYAEDVDLCYRIRKSGWQIHYLAEESIVHHEGASSRKKTNRHFSALMQCESNSYFLRKSKGVLSSWLYRFVILVGSLYRILLSFAFYPILKRTAKGFSVSDVIGKYTTMSLWSFGLRKSGA
jgi:GT2 family glycosyltransferase